MRILIVIILTLVPMSSFADIIGIPRIVDGDTIHIGKTKTRLWGYDSPEQKQIYTIKGEFWKCGQAATEYLKTFIGDNPVSCVEKDRGRYGRIIAKSRVGTLDIGAKMVEVGLAIPYWKYNGKYYIQSYRGLVA